MDFIQQVQRTVSFEANPQNNNSKEMEPNDIMQIVLNLKNQTERHIQIQKNKIFTLEKEVSELRDKLSKVSAIAYKIQDKEVVERSREAAFSRRDKPPADKPIDRNGVAPADVEITKIFNCAGKRF